MNNNSEKKETITKETEITLEKREWKKRAQDLYHVKRVQYIFIILSVHTTFKFSRSLSLSFSLSLSHSPSQTNSLNIYFS